MRRSCGVFLLLAASPAFAQLPRIIFSGSGASASGAYRGSATFRFPTPTIQVMVNAPYSGQEKIEHTLGTTKGVARPTLLDQKVWRDSQGRIRIEKAFGPNAPTVVEIQDPVAGYIYIMDDITKVVHRIKVTISPQKNLEEVTTRTVPASVAAISTLEDLGTQTMDGLSVHGTRRIYNYPAGSRGNKAAFTSTRDYWYSPDLNLIIRTVTTDPRSGGETEGVTNLSRDEPDPAKFVVPVDYKLVDETGEFTIQWK